MRKSFKIIGSLHVKFANIYSYYRNLDASQKLTFSSYGNFFKHALACLSVFDLDFTIVQFFLYKHVALHSLNMIKQYHFCSVNPHQVQNSWVYELMKYPVIFPFLLLDLNKGWFSLQYVYWNLSENFHWLFSLWNPSVLFLNFLFITNIKMFMRASLSIICFFLNAHESCIQFSPSIALVPTEQ